MISTGSGTGAYSSMTPHPTPSFALMDVDGSKVGLDGVWGGLRA